jgi:hypothetical protein
VTTPTSSPDSLQEPPSQAASPVEMPKEHHVPVHISSGGVWT